MSKFIRYGFTALIAAVISFGLKAYPAEHDFSSESVVPASASSAHIPPHPIEVGAGGRNKARLSAFRLDASGSYYDAPYAAQQMPDYTPGRPHSSVDEAVAEWWAMYQQVWSSAFPGCTYTLTPHEDAQETGQFEGLDLHGTCGGGQGFYGTLYAFDAGQNNGEGAGCDGGEGSAGGGGSGSGGDAPSCESSKGVPDVGTPSAGDPINTASGNKYIQEDDYVVSDWLRFRRFYNSHASAPSSAMGKHWSHSFNRTLTRVNYPSGSSSVTVLRPSGLREIFRKSGAGAWTTVPSNPDILSESQGVDGGTTGYTLWVAARRHMETYGVDGRLLTIQDDTGQRVTLGYSDSLTDPSVAPRSNLLLTVTAPDGRSLAFQYDASARIRQINLPDGGFYLYGYDAAGNLISTTYPDGKIRQYVYNESTLTGGASLPSAMTGIVDESAARFEDTAFDAQGRATMTQFAGGVGKVTVQYNADGSSDVTYPTGAISHQGYATVQGLFRVATLDKPCGECGQPYASRTYDANSRPATYTDFNGNVTAVTYDTNGLLTKVIDAQGTAAERTTTTTWDTALRVPLSRTVVDHSGAVVQRESWSYNDRGQVLATCAIDPAVTGNYSCGSQSNAPSGIRQTRYTYCDAIDATQCPLVGLLLTVDGPRTDVADITRLSYYLATDESGCSTVGGACHRAGDLAQSTDALGKVTSVLSYDKAGRILRRKDANGVITDFTYTPRGWLSSRTIRARADGTASSGDVTTTMAYDATGTLHSIVDPDGVTLTYTYDAAHRLTDITDGAGNRLHYTLDAAGHRVKEETFDTQQVSRRLVSRSYNTLGQLIGVTDGLGHKVFDASGASNYDANGNLLTSQGPLGAIHQDTYDALNRVVTAIDDANGAGQATRNTTMQYVLDALDRVTKVTDPDGLATQYGFDGLGRPTSLNSPDSGASAATFDAAGNALTQTDARGVTVTNVYDALGRRSASHYADAKLDVAFNFDEADSATGCQGSYAQGRLTRIVESAVTTTYCYDALGRVTEKRQKQGAITDTTDYVYTRAGRLAAVAAPSGTVTEYTRDALGEITTVKVTPAQGVATPVVTAATYLPFGPLMSYTLGNGQVVTRSYDANYQVTDVTSPALNLHFARDAAGNITALGDAPGAQPASETYGYDPLYRLTSVNDASGQAIEAYTYNKTGDRLSKQAPGLATGAYGYAPGTHWLTSIGTASRTYDAKGSTTGSASAGNAWGYGYDGRGRLTVVQQNGATTATYTYNALGQRVAKIVGGTSQRFAYGEDSLLLGEYSTAARDYIWMDAMPVAVVDGTAINYVHADGLNTPRAVTNALGTGVWQWRYAGNPFGEQGPSSPTGYRLNLRFPGQYFDAESGLNYNVNRDYDSSTGRYVESDPVGLVGGVSTFLYASSRPLASTDALGLDDSATMFNPRFWNPNSSLASPACDDGYWDRYRDRYLDWTADHVIDVGPYAAAMGGGLWPKSWAPATGGRPPLLGSTNPLTSVPRGFGVPGAGSSVVRGGAFGIGLATVGIGFYDATIILEGFLYAIPEN